MPLDKELLEILVCPRCLGELDYREKEAALLCPACRLRYPISEDDIPVLMIEEATPLEG